jgi:hypothetical protein
MDNWHKDKKWSDKFMPQIKKELGSVLICESSYEDDALKNTDLTVIGMGSLNIACRVRRYKYFNSEYRSQFTVRCVRSSGNKTELTKIIEGWGDYMFYGFCDELEKDLIHWKILDLKVFRRWFSWQLVKNNGAVPGEQIPNNDGGSEFLAFDTLKMPQELIVKEFTY